MGSRQITRAPVIAPPFANGTNTGPDVAGYTLTDWTGSYLFDTNDQIITGKRFTGVGPQVTASNVLFRGCEIQETFPDGFAFRVDGANVQFEDCRWRPISNTTPPITRPQSYQQGIKLFTGARGLTVLRCEFYGFGNAIEFEPECSQEATPFLIKDSYFHDAADQSGDTYHHDGILSSAASQFVTVDNCSIVSGGNTNAIAFQSIPGNGPWNNITVKNCLLGGFGYTVNFGDDIGASDITFINNTLTTLIEPNFGPLKNTWTNFGGTNAWAGNKYLVPLNAAYGDPEWNGKFWWPNDGKLTGGHDIDYAG